MTTKHKYHPLRDNVVIKRDAKTEKKSSGGIIIDVIDEGPFATGVLLAVGPGEVLYDGTVRALDVKAGDKVLFCWGEAAKIGQGDDAVYVGPHTVLLTTVEEYEVPDAVIPPPAPGLDAIPFDEPPAPSLIIPSSRAPSA